MKKTADRSWLLLRIEIGGRDPAAVEAALVACGAQSVTLDDAGDDPVLEPGPGETPLWPSTRATGLFPGDADRALLRVALANALGTDPLPAHEFVALDDRTWEREWLKDFRPMRFGDRLWVVPGDHLPPDPGAVNLLLDPGLAFGTGTHATTALCLEWLESRDLRGQVVVDYGCGSGILAVAAALLGARSVVALDIDPQALIAARENAERNGVSARIAVHSTAPTVEASILVDRSDVGATQRVAMECPTPHDPGTVGATQRVAIAAGGKAKFLVANILAAPLVALAPRFRKLVSPGAEIALAGLIARQADEVAAAYADWCPLTERVERDGWVRLSGTAR